MDSVTLERRQGAEPRDHHSPPSAVPFPVVGVGASAGGLEALEALFEHMPVNPGMAFVVLQHLSPDFESHMDELLARKTRIPVRQVCDGVVIESDHIYLIPPRKEMIISGNRLLLTEKDPQRGLSLPIDQFLRSLANEQGKCAVAIILSGTGSDGSRGIKAVHEAGGLVICQSEPSAKFDGMPRAALQTGVVDLVLPPESMPAALVRHAERIRQGQWLGIHNEIDSVVHVPGGLQRILDLLRERCGIDFAFYKPATVVRRIERRLKMGASSSIEEYALQLERDGAELEALYQDLLIGVTRFFRDVEAFEVLETQVIPSIVKNNGSGEEIRVWCAGCATGEEPYSIAILLHEQLHAAGRPINVRVFASDVHRASLEHASRGIYSEESLSNVSPARRERYFISREDDYQVAKEIRQMIVFAPHNIVGDAPFTRLDLLTCRNLLIYLQPSAQKKTLSLFHFALRTGGFLFLGSSETPGELNDEFEPIDKQWRIYRKRRDVQLSTTLRMPYATMPRVQTRGLAAGWPAPFSDRSVLNLYDQMLARYMPPGILVDEQHNVLHTFGGAERFLRIPSGRPSTNILDLIVPPLRAVVAGTLQHAFKIADVVRHSAVPVKEHDADRQYRVQAEPLVDERTKATAYLLTLEDVTPADKVDAVAPTVELGEDSEDRIYTLETELRFTKESLQATIEELEASNEELQATNEELVSSNEELQSTNEELHSVNEELYTVNGELERKIAELTETTADLDSVLQITDVGVLFVDTELRIRRFTPKIMGAFSLLPQDVGRPISAFTHKLQHASFLPDIERALHEGMTTEHDVEDADGRSYYLRIFPYLKGRATCGVVVTLLDLTPLRHAESGRRRLASIVASSTDAIIALDLEGVVTAWNRGATRMYGFGSDEMLGETLDRLIPDQRRDEFASTLARARRGEQIEYLDTVRRRKDGREIHVSLQVSPIRGASGSVTGISTIERDISPRIAAEDEIRQAVRDRERFLGILSHELRNPLAAVLGASRVFTNPRTREDMRARSASVIERQTRHMARLLDDLLDVSRIREGNFAITKAPVDLRQVAELAVEAVAGLFDEKHVRLDVDLGDAPVVTVGDAHRLQQVISNLLTNALRHTPEGKKVTFILGRDHDEASLMVRDEGDGMPLEILEKIFDPFVTTNAASRSGGLGIGLWLVRSIAQAHGGDARARSNGRGCGSEFTVSLPILQMQEVAAPSSGEAVVEGKILLIEDHDDLRELMQSLLEAEGFTVVACGSAERGLEELVRYKPEIAVVDVGLPGMSGIEFARRVRDGLAHGGLSLIALTGFGQQSDADKIRSAGFRRHLVKPVDIDVLYDVICEELRRARADR